MVFIIILLLMPTTISGADLLFKDCPSRTYTANSPFENKLKLLLQSLSSNTSISGGFYNDTIGNSSDRVYGQALCRGDVNSTVYQSCVHDASQDIFKSCKAQEAIWYELCQVRYSSTQFFTMMLYDGKIPEKNKQEKNVSNPNQFGDVLKNLMKKLLEQTAYTSKHMFATGDMKFSGRQSIYGLQQCTRDIPPSDCYKCLDIALTELQKCCSALEGGTIVSRNCNVRFELDQFFNDIYSKD
ncbi:cysteine-rich repeat secretory protein 38-like [Rosa rugosa]|uniref:cysteine-rich repeat secretory protein 38-like n=1 Tax=Rosa rugosa TaxID=74645 RepID=UPI002B4166E2|nr:cysteine-rich repeat secretory protein 38-like [Rosa rugosa]